MRKTTRLALVLVLIASVTARAQEGTPTESWDRLDMAGAPAGWVHTKVRRIEGEKPGVETTVRTELRMQRMGQTTEIFSTEKTLEAADGLLIRIESTSKMSATETSGVCTFADGKVTIETTVMGQTRKIEKPLPAGVIGPFKASERTAALAGTSGQTLELLTFMADFQSAVRVTTVSKGKETVKLGDGTSSELTRLESKLALDGGAPIPMSPISWIDAKGEVLRGSVNAGGIPIEIWRVRDEAAAKGRGSKEPAPDVFAATLIQEDGPLPVPRRVEEATIVVTKRRPDVVLDGIADSGHVVTARKDGALEVRASRRVPAADKEGVRPLEKVPPDLADALGPSSVIQSDAPEIQAVVKEVVPADASAWKAAQILERWVHDSVTAKNMNVAFATALEVCKSREGDCTEHAVLLAALCRAAGVPARVVMGVEYLAGIWGGHAWNEVWIAGDWYPLDGTNGLGFVDPLHVPLGRMTMKDGGAAEFVQMLGSLGGMDLDVVEVTRAGRKIAVDDAALVTTEKGRHVNRALGIAYVAPQGWEFDPPSKRPQLQVKVMEIDGKTSDGKTVEIEVDMMDAPVHADLDKFLAELRIDRSQVAAGEVDGRPSRRVTRAKESRSEIRVGVIADGALWLFTLDRADGEAERAAFDAFLASVDFDVK